MRVWFNGRTAGCQSAGGSSILPTRKKNEVRFSGWRIFCKAKGAENRSRSPDFLDFFEHI